MTWSPRERFGAGGGGGGGGGGKGTHCTTCARVAAKQGRGGEGGHTYIYPKINILTHACHLSPRDIGGSDGEGGWLGAPYAPRKGFGAGGGGGGEGTHPATCVRGAARSGRGGEGGHVYMNPTMNILTYPCHLSPHKRDLEVATWRVGAQAGFKGVDGGKASVHHVRHATWRW